MKELNLKDRLIQDIKELSPDLLPVVYNYLQSLKGNGINQRKSIEPFIGCISDEEAKAQKELIEREFENIEGEW